MQEVRFACIHYRQTLPIQNLDQTEARICQLPRLRLRTYVIGHERQVMPTIDKDGVFR